METVAVAPDPDTATNSINDTSAIEATDAAAVAVVNGTNDAIVTAPTSADEGRFIELLKELAFNGSEPIFHSKSKWQDLCKIERFKNDARFTPFDSAKYEQIAHDEFEKFCWNISDQLAEPKKKLKQLLKSSNYTISPNDTVTHLMNVFNDTLHKECIAEATHLRLLFAEMIAKQQYLSTKRQNNSNEAHNRQYSRATKHRNREHNNKRIKLSSFDHEDDRKPSDKDKTYTRAPINRDRRRENDRERNRRRERSKSPHNVKESKTTASASSKSYPTLPPPFPPPQAYLEMMHRHHENLKKHIERDRLTKNGYRDRERSRSRERNRGRYYRGRRREDNYERERRNGARDRDRDRMHMIRERRNERERERSRVDERSDRRYTKHNSTIKKDFDVGN